MFANLTQFLISIKYMEFQMKQYWEVKSWRHQKVRQQTQLKQQRHYNDYSQWKIIWIMKKNNLNINLYLQYIFKHQMLFKLIKKSISFNKLFYFNSLTRKNNHHFTNQEKPKLTKQQLNSLHQQITQNMLKGSLEDDSSFEKEKSPPIKKFFIGLLAVALGFTFTFFYVHKVVKKQDAKQQLQKLNQFQQLGIGGQWQLFNTQGIPFKSKSLNGNYYLIYFGFTKCPDVCPSFLINWSRALRSIRQSSQTKYIKLKSLFVTLDPDRDTPQVLQKYLRNFDPAIIGLTANDNQDSNLKDCMKKFKVYRNKIQIEKFNPQTNKTEKSYTLDHTTMAFLMSDENQLVAILPSSQSPQNMASTIISKILKRENLKIKLVTKD